MIDKLFYILLFFISSCSTSKILSYSYNEYFANTVPITGSDYLEIEKHGDTLYYYRPPVIEYSYLFIDDTSGIDKSKIIMLEGLPYRKDSTCHDRLLQFRFYWKVNKSSDTIVYQAFPANHNLSFYHNDTLPLSPQNYLIINKHLLSHADFFPSLHSADDWTARSHSSPGVTVKCSYLGKQKIEGHQTHCFEFVNTWKYDNPLEWKYLLYLDKKTLLPFAFDIQYYEMQSENELPVDYLREKYIRRR